MLLMMLLYSCSLIMVLWLIIPNRMHEQTTQFVPFYYHHLSSSSTMTIIMITIIIIIYYDHYHHHYRHHHHHLCTRIISRYQIYPQAVMHPERRLIYHTVTNQQSYLCCNYDSYCANQAYQSEDEVMSLKESTISPGSGEYSRQLLVNSAVEATIALFTRI